MPKSIRQNEDSPAAPAAADVPLSVDWIRSAGADGWHRVRLVFLSDSLRVLDSHFSIQYLSVSISFLEAQILEFRILFVEVY